MGKYTPVHVEVKLRPNETSERLVKRFLKKMKKSTVLEDFREHTYYKKPSLKRREKEKNRQRVLNKLKSEEEKLASKI